MWWFPSLLTTESMWDPAHLLSTENLLALLMLTALEIVLGIDNIVFIAILTSRLPQAVQSQARKIGLAGAMVMRILLLLSISTIMSWNTYTLIPLPDWLASAHHAEVAQVEPPPATSVTPPVTMPETTTPVTAPTTTSTPTPPHANHPAAPLTVKDLVLLIGGLFLIFKSTREIHEKFHHAHEKDMKKRKVTSFGAAIVQIMILDIVFSLDSVITAVGTAKSVLVMILAVVVAVGVMMVFANAVSRFVENNPTIKMLALSFLLLIGVMLVAESLGKEIEKGYIYFAMGFSLAVEMLNIYTTRKPAEPTPTPAATTEPALPSGEPPAA